MSVTLLIRDSLTDTGQANPKKHYGLSPDIILHEPIDNPADFFQWSYNHDVSEPQPPRGGRMPVYIRAKNTGQNTAFGYVYMYWAEPELFMYPALWRTHRLCTEEGDNYSPIGPVTAGKIGVCAQPFILEANLGRHYSLIAILQEKNEQEPVIPDFTDYSVFVEWIKNNPNIALKCADIVQKDIFPDGLYKNSLHINTPLGEQERRYTIRISLNSAFPEGCAMTLDSSLFDGTPLKKSIENGYSEQTWDVTVNRDIKQYSGVVDFTLQLPLTASLHGDGMVSACIGILENGNFSQLGGYTTRIVE